jgi:hypothetical protein
MKRPRHFRTGTSATSRKPIAFVSTLAAALFTLFSALAMAGQANITEAQKELLRNLPATVRTLYVLGDLNGDGQVDRQDLALLRALVYGGSATPRRRSNALQPVISISTEKSTATTSTC